MPGPNLYARMGVPPTFDEPHKWVTSPLIRNPFVLAAIRGTIALFTLSTIVVTLTDYITRRHQGERYLSFFTYLTLIGLFAYFSAATIHTTSYALAWRRKGAGAGYALQRWPKVLQALHVVLHSTIVTFPFVVTITFWVVLADGDVFETPVERFSNTATHALNSAFALFEILLTNTPPPPWLPLSFCIVILGGYLGVAYITHATQGFYTYDFLDPTQGSALLAGWIIGIMAGQVVLYSIVKGIIHLRQMWARRSGRILVVHRGIESGSEGDLTEEWEEVVGPTASSPVRPSASGGNGGAASQRSLSPSPSSIGPKDATVDTNNPELEKKIGEAV